MKKILGLDLGTNSIGWAVVNAETQENETKAISIEAAGSRIIPMDAEIMGKFEAGNSISQTAERTKYRGIRRLLERAVNPFCNELQRGEMECNEPHLTRGEKISTFYSKGVVYRQKKSFASFFAKKSPIHKPLLTTLSYT